LSRAVDNGIDPATRATAEARRSGARTRGEPAMTEPAIGGQSGVPGEAAERERRQPPRLSGRNAYSLFISCMKLLLPAIAVGLVILVIIWPQLKPIDNRFRINVEDLSIEQAESLSMLNARFEGRDEKNQPYSLTADVATQVPGDEEIIDFDLPKGDIMLNDGVWLAVTAKAGRFHRKTEILELTGEVTLFHDQGYEIHTESAEVNLQSGVAEGFEPIEGQGPGGFLSAEGFRILERGERVFFTGRSSLIAFTDAEGALK
jgi:lipopolysaccharide export system protein LptC